MVPPSGGEVQRSVPVSESVRAQLTVTAGCEHEVTGRHDQAAAHLGDAGAGDAARGEPRVVAEAHLPLDDPGVQVVAREFGERRLHHDADGAVGVDHVLGRLLDTIRVGTSSARSPAAASRPALCASGADDGSWWEAGWSAEPTTASAPAPAPAARSRRRHEVGDERLQLHVSDVRKAGHAPLTGADRRSHGSGVEKTGEVQQRWPVLGAAAIGSMADGTLALIGGRPGLSCRLVGLHEMQNGRIVLADHGT